MGRSVELYGGHRVSGYQWAYRSREDGRFHPHANLTSAGTFDFKKDDYKFTLRNVRSKTKIKVTMDGALPAFQVTINLKAVLSELASNQPTDDLGFIRLLEKDVAAQIRLKITNVIRKLQGLNSDVIEFGEQFRVQQQKIWGKADWKGLFPQVRFQVNVNVRIVRGGVLK